MWLKLAHKKWWIALCILVTIGPFLKDLRRVSPKVSSLVPRTSTHRPKVVTAPQRVMRGYQEIQPPTEEITLIPRAKPIIARQGLATLAGNSQVQRIDKGWQKRTDQDTEPKYVQSIRHTNLKIKTFGYKVRPDWGNWRLTSEPELMPSPTGNVVKAEVWFRPLSPVKPGVSYAVAWKPEARTVVEYPLPSQSGVVFGPTLDFKVESRSQGALVSLNIPGELRSQFYGQDLIYKLYAIDTAGRSHESDVLPLNYYESGIYRNPYPIEVVYQDVEKDQIRSLRLVAAPLHWVEFRDPPSTPEEKLAAKGVYPIPAALRDKLLDGGLLNHEARYAGEIGGTVLIEATNFPPALTAHAVPDAVVVGSGTPYKEQGAHSDTQATFTVFMPRYLGDRTLYISVYDSYGRHFTTRSYTTIYPSNYVTGIHLPGKEAEFATAVVHRFPSFRQSDVRRIVISSP